VVDAAGGALDAMGGAVEATGEVEDARRGVGETVAGVDDKAASSGGTGPASDPVCAPDTVSLSAACATVTASAWDPPRAGAWASPRTGVSVRLTVRSGPNARRRIS